MTTLDTLQISTEETLALDEITNAEAAAISLMGIVRQRSQYHVGEEPIDGRVNRLVADN